MNKHIKEQLEKCKVAKFVYDEGSTEILIPKVQDILLFVGDCYSIKVNLKRLSIPDEALFTINWNGGRQIIDEYLNICITDIKQDKVKFDGVSTTESSHVYNGFWINSKNIEILSKL